ncbi:MAG: DUF2249 domain-containing protein [Chloroflexi bacterium]|nr:DUF2249 domain-containing protein [Chloroflexota bacterium]
MADTTIQTTSVGEAIHAHHQEILDTLREHVAAIVAGEGHANPSALLAFLKGDLLPHAQGEEAHLYPAVDPLVKAHGTATATMMIDHEYITSYIDRIANVMDVTRALRSADSAGGHARQANLSTLQRLCLQLEAVLVAHLDKEERVYIPLLEMYLSKEEQQRILSGMHEASRTAPSDSTFPPQETWLDVRAIAPRQRHETIFDTFNALRSGHAFVLVNDHDPKPLYYQFKAEFEGLFTWTYLEQGPETWQLRIVRV